MNGIERQVDEARDVAENLLGIGDQRLISHFQIVRQKLGLLPRFSDAPHPKDGSRPDITARAEPQVGQKAVTAF